MPAGQSSAVVVANGTYAKQAPLVRAVPDSESLATLLEGRHDYEVVRLLDLRRGDLIDKLESVLPQRGMSGASLIVLWTGHGERGADGTLRLIARTSGDADGEVVNAGRLGELAAGTGAKQILVVLDTCYSGAGLPSAHATADAVLQGRADQSAVWFGVVAASQAFQRARSGALAGELERLLSEGPGPSAPDMILRWNSPEIRGADLIDALLREWDDDPLQMPRTVSTGVSMPMIRNPRFRRGAVDEVADHLVQAARGTSTGQNFFTGRTHALAAIVRWIQDRAPGVFVVTGPPGSGKSGILGRIVSLSSPTERARVLAEPGPPPATEHDPGESSVDAHVHARGMDTKAAAAALASQLGLDASAGTYGVLAHASTRRASGDPLTIVIDGLDEAGDVECREIALQLIAPLRAEALVLLGTREVPSGPNEPGLLALLGAAANNLDLGHDVAATLDDVEEYVVRRLSGISDAMQPALVAAEVRAIASAADPSRVGPFLLARLITSQLRAQPVDTAPDGWQSQLAASVEAALENDLESTLLTINGRPEPTAARELLNALAYTHGSGLPADDLWPALATALSPRGIVYTRDDVYRLLVTLGRHVVIGNEGDQAVYRIAHQRLVEHLRPSIDTGSGVSVPPDVAVPIAETVVRLYNDLLDLGLKPAEHPYLWRYAWRHCADADAPGLELLRPLINRDTSTFTEDLALALSVVAQHQWWRGEAANAVVLLEEAVAIRRELGDDVGLAIALYELALAQSSAGKVEAADSASSEGTRLARRAGTNPASRVVLTTALTMRALVQLRGGSSSNAVAMATEASSLAEQDLPDSNGAYVAACTIGALAAIYHGDIEQADDLSRRALEVLEQQGDDAGPVDAALIESLSTRARVELIRMTTIDGRPSDPATLTGLRILDMHARTGPTNSLSDIVVGEGLRLLAQTLRILDQAGTDVSSLPPPRQLIDDAIDLESPLAGVSLEAAIALATCLESRAAYFAPNLDAARADLERADDLIRPHVPDNPMAALCLGEISNVFVRLHLSAGTPVQELLDRQWEAVEFLDAAAAGHYQQVLLADALGRLRAMLMATGAGDQAASIAELQVDVARDLRNGSAQSDISLAAHLIDLAGLLFLGRPLEATRWAQEALDILSSLPDGVEAAGLAGLSQVNLAAALMNLGRHEESRDVGAAAVSQLGSFEGASSPRHLREGLAQALVNLAVLNVEAGDAPAALRHSERVLKLFDAGGIPDSVAALAKVCRSRALQDLGRASEADELSAVIQSFEEGLTLDDEGSQGRLAAALDAAGPASWDEAMTRLNDRPGLQRRMAVLRIRPAHEVDLLVRDLSAALGFEDETHEFIRVVRNICRMRRSSDPTAFDEAWERAVGPVPDWLSIELALVQLVIAWVNSDTADQARAFLQDNPELLSPLVDIVIDEFMPDASEALKAKGARCKARRADAIVHGVDAAYREELAEMEVHSWLDEGYSSTFLAIHREALLSADVEVWLQSVVDDEGLEFAQARSLLELVRGGEEPLAYRILDDHKHGMAQLEPAWRSTHYKRLIAIATLTYLSAPAEGPEWREAAVALAIGTALSGDAEEAAAWAGEAIDEIDDASERESLLAAAIDALTAHPNEFHKLQPVIGVLKLPDPPDAP